MMNLGVVLPEPGFLEGVRALTKKHGIVLIFDEVKIGICTARGGAVERWGVVPDMVTLGKAIAGGTPCGAIGGTEEIMAKVNDGTVFQVGTYSGNPLSMAAARASFEQVMTDDAYAHLNHLNDRIIAKCDAVCAKYDFPGYTVGISSKGCVNFALGKITDYESFIKYQDARARRPGVALQHQPRHHHRPRPRRGVDALHHAHRRRRRPLRRRVRGPRPRRHRLTLSTDGPAAGSGAGRRARKGAGGQQGRPPLRRRSAPPRRVRAPAAAVSVAATGAGRARRRARPTMSSSSWLTSAHTLSRCACSSPASSARDCRSALTSSTPASASLPRMLTTVISSRRLASVISATVRRPSTCSEHDELVAAHGQRVARQRVVVAVAHEHRGGLPQHLDGQAVLAAEGRDVEQHRRACRW